ncbi:hypothetical protein F5146DRAFT_1006566 [Armillaria mellea]|nr:hypothetical protein F5146DRAFT_1006566 [Armillaria mellea]
MTGIQRLASLEDTLPVGPALLQESGTVPAAANSLSHPRVTLHVHECIHTLANLFGLTRIYHRKPTQIPDMGKQQEAYLASNVTAAKEQKKCKIMDIIYSYPNVSAFLFNHWFRTGSNKKSDKEHSVTVGWKWMDLINSNEGNQEGKGTSSASMVENNPALKDFHWHGFKENWQPLDPTLPSEQVYGELYTSEAFLKAEHELLSAVADNDLP